MKTNANMPIEQVKESIAARNLKRAGWEMCDLEQLGFKTFGDLKKACDERAAYLKRARAEASFHLKRLVSRYGRRALVMEIKRDDPDLNAALGWLEYDGDAKLFTNDAIWQWRTVGELVKHVKAT